MANTKRVIAPKERLYEKYSWLLLLPIDFVGLFFGVYFAFGFQGGPNLRIETGMTWQQLVSTYPGIAGAMASFAVGFGALLMAFFLTVLAITMIPFRRRERWAWYVLWAVPAFLAFFVYSLNSSTPTGDWPMYLVILVVTLPGLILPYRQFFPK